MAFQLDHKGTSLKSSAVIVKVLCDGLSSPANVGSLFRICDAFGVNEIIFCNAVINFSSNRLLRTARDTQKKISYRVSENVLEEIEILKKENFKILALEITTNSIALDKINFNNENKIALVIGNEQNGVSEAVLAQIPTATHIDMYGKNSSMNVTHAAAIALYSLTKI